ncbi:hypothetical protein Tco_1097801 [Tanacetum coccineum]
MSEEKEIVEIFRIEMDIFDFKTPLCKAFKEFNHLLQIDVDVLTGDLPVFKTYEDYKDAWIYECNREVSWVEKKLYWKVRGDMRIEKKNFGGEREKTDESSDDAWRNYSPNDDNDAIQVDQEQFNNHKLMKDDDDIMDLDDYLIQQDVSYYINEEEEIFKERKSKLLGMPYEKPPTFKSKKFEVVKYSLGLEEEYVAIKDYEYDIWL